MRQHLVNQRPGPPPAAAKMAAHLVEGGDVGALEGIDRLLLVAHDKQRPARGCWRPRPRSVRRRAPRSAATVPGWCPAPRPPGYGRCRRPADTAPRRPARGRSAMSLARVIRSSKVQTSPARPCGPHSRQETAAKSCSARVFSAAERARRRCRAASTLAIRLLSGSIRSPMQLLDGLLGEAADLRGVSLFRVRADALAESSLPVP
jgi:hypothetical protein